MKKRTVNYKGLMAGSLIVVLLIASTCFGAEGGNLDTTRTIDQGSGMPSLQGIYEQLNSGTLAGNSTSFQGPATGPTAGTGKSLSDIQLKLPTADNTNGAATTDVLSGKTFWGLRTDGTWGLKTGSLTSRDNVTGANGLLNFTIPDGYYSGKSATANDTNLVTGNIKSGATIFGVSGKASVVDTASATAAAGDMLSGKTAYVNGAQVTGSMPTQTLSNTSTTVNAGYYSATTLDAVDTNLSSGNIKSGVTIFGVSGAQNVVDTTEAAGPVAATNISKGKKAWVNGALVTGTVAPVIIVNKTGQTTSYATGDAGYYQYGIDPAIAPTGGITGAYNTPSYTGTRFIDNGDGTVTDILTALIWLKNANCTDTVEGIVKSVGYLNWANALTWSNNLASGKCGLTDGSTAAQWRLPNINELHSLGPTWPPGTPFTAVQGSFYWSGSSYDTSDAWVVNMWDGYVLNGSKNNSSYVWPVRSGQ